ncbi:helix-turn-helix transcriptional regulator [Photobacterium sp. OFAV2-7]|uniref:helix-turn-helix transcriptional regulator n=1 Tax=Photobacterium sp. OFAV2-7 TaxID=2917748 RepID=UPI001EF70308|nr:AraC family transcriptional regulator [Photobacterium sp. OFAV2-7]MCG7588607.1 AraC family transcriptional regulator [Photobacterium sp. OFAV2-7]
MKSHLKFYDFDSDALSDCGQVLDIEFSNHGLDWPCVIIEKGTSPHFYPQHVYTPYFYFALGLERELNWSAETDSGITNLKTTPGNIWINPPKTPFTHNIDEPCYFVILAIEEKTFLSHCSLNIEGKQLQFLNNYNVVDETIKGIMELFLIEAREKGRNQQVYLGNLLSLLSTYYVQNYSNYFDLQSVQRTASKFDQQQLEVIDEYISENIGGNICVDDLAELLRCSKYYFLREFKKLMGVTPYQYLMNKRLDQAKGLLSSGNTHIASVGQQLGFNDQSHFTRAFKNRFGLTPGQFVKQHQL